jgi:uncharacterized membrane protein YfcA
LREANRDRPIDVEAGRSPARERLWGIIGGIVASLFGVGSAVIAVYVEGASWFERPYPAFFSQRRLLVYDLFLVAGFCAGAGFTVVGLVLCRLGRYPRSDAFGALLVGAILGIVSASILVTRLVVVIRGG